MLQALQQLSPHRVDLMAVQPLRQLVLLVQLPHLQVCFGFDTYSFPIMIWRISGLPEADFRSDFPAFVFTHFYFHFFIFYFLSNYIHILFIRVFKYVQVHHHQICFWFNIFFPHHDLMNFQPPRDWLLVWLSRVRFFAIFLVKSHACTFHTSF